MERGISILIILVVVVSVGGFFIINMNSEEKLSVSADVPDNTVVINDTQKEVEINIETKDTIIQDEGDFLLVYDVPKNESYNIYIEWLNAYAFDEELDSMNSLFVLPYDISVKFTECGEANAWYDSETRNISMCYELMSEFEELFTMDAQTQQEKDQIEVDVIDNTFWTFYHEMGHAFVDAYNFSFTREEDAADELSTTILIESGDIGKEAAVAGAWGFLLQSEIYEASPLWDDHSLDEDRFENILCWIYGADSENYGWLVEDGAIPLERAPTCSAEYSKINAIWDVNLDPYRKQ
jgi:hypothetical protein